MKIKKAVRKGLFAILPPWKMPDFMLERWCDREYRHWFGRHVNFREPKTFNEKIQWYKIYYRNPELHRIVDKIRFKSYVEERLGPGYTPKLYAAWTRYEDVDFSGLKPPYVLKSNCSYGGKNILFVRDPAEDTALLKERIRPWFERDGDGLCILKNKYAYWGLTPSVFAEEYVADIGESPTDYKFFCFDGKPYCVYSAVEHFADGKAKSSKISFYDMDWNVLDVRYGHAQPYPLEKPAHFAQMRDMAAKLSVGFPFVRVDFYDIARGPLLSEMTFYSADGFKMFTPIEFDTLLGEQMILPKEKRSK